MKKYIRTQTKIKEIETKIDNKELFDYLAQFDNYKNDLIKVADTIEELCDEFVDTSELKTTNPGGWLYDEFDSKNKCLVYYAEDERRTIPLNEFEDLSKIYGAVWTDKGLIYVAKMNDKGELELL